MRSEDPLEMSADTILHTLCKTSFGFKEFGKRLFAVFRIAMQVDSAPGTIFSVQQLVRTFQFIVVVLSTATVCTTPVLNDVPIRTLATIAGGDKALIAARGVETADDIATFLCKVLGQDALVL